MRKPVHRPLPDSFVVPVGPRPSDDGWFRTPHLHMLWNVTDTPWADPAPHFHTDSDELLIVLDGTVHVEIDGERLDVTARELCAFPAGCRHAIVGGEPPIRAMVIRAPSIGDKISLDPAPEEQTDDVLAE